MLMYCVTSNKVPQTPALVERAAVALVAKCVNHAHKCPKVVGLNPTTACYNNNLGPYIEHKNTKEKPMCCDICGSEDNCLPFVHYTLGSNPSFTKIIFSMFFFF